MTISYQDAEEKSALHERESSQQDYLIHSLSLPAAIISGSDKLVAFNLAFKNLLPEIKSSNDFSTFMSHLQPEEATFSRQHRINLREMRFPLSVYNPHSKSRFVLNTGRLSDHATGTLLLIIEDATALLSSQKQRQVIHEKLLHTSRTISVGEMSTVLAHELKQPLATINNYLSIAQKLITDTGKRKESLQAINFAQKQTRQASEIISRIREFVKTREPRFKRHSPTSLLQPALSLLQLDINDQQIIVDIEEEENLPDILADSVMIEQVFSNLIRNAIESMSKTPASNRQLSIAVLLSDTNYITYKISDSGCGITTDQQTHLFTPFFTTKNDGMGVGLSICRSIIELHGGRLFLDVRDDNKTGGGSTFICMLPTAPKI